MNECPHCPHCLAETSCYGDVIAGHEVWRCFACDKVLVVGPKVTAFGMPPAGVWIIPDEVMRRMAYYPCEGWRRSTELSEFE